MIFYDEQHKQAYMNTLSKMKSFDNYHHTIAYLFTLPTVRTKINNLFDFEQDSIKVNGLSADWQSSSTKKITRLAFNLWNDYQDEYTNPADIFSTSDAPYLMQAVKLRFDIEE